MPSEKTKVTELATALGMLRYRDASAAIAARAPELDLTDAQWGSIAALLGEGRYAAEFRTGFENGLAFLEAGDGLRHRPPVLVEWTGGRRGQGDEIAPIDLRVDHVYLVSCKYESRVLANASPARVFDGLLATRGSWQREHWYQAVAPDEYQALYEAYIHTVGLAGQLPAAATALEPHHFKLLKAVPSSRSYPLAAQGAYQALCRKVSAESALRWRTSVGRRDGEVLVWRLLRVGSAPYFILGVHSGFEPVRLRVASPWDWRQRFKFLSLDITPGDAGQPQVDWSVSYLDRTADEIREARGHVEIRWSHGRFAGAPEAKVYADTPIPDMPGYFPLH